ncbi:MAG: hypothetical protein A3F10_01745 [Coxiella sp. RIFCSPHIGHO2_12_FULL_42_15]|nr:MAG: hypothetical protein A3F10_01745 [Coxiella sp. RIFCSPHIGHO2_12_FULL_42_15]
MSKSAILVQILDLLYYDADILTFNTLLLNALTPYLNKNSVELIILIAPPAEKDEQGILSKNGAFSRVATIEIIGLLAQKLKGMRYRISRDMQPDLLSLSFQEKFWHGHTKKILIRHLSSAHPLDHEFLKQHDVTPIELKTSHVLSSHLEGVKKRLHALLRTHEFQRLITILDNDGTLLCNFRTELWKRTIVNISVIKAAKALHTLGGKYPDLTIEAYSMTARQKAPELHIRGQHPTAMDFVAIEAKKLNLNLKLDNEISFSFPIWPENEDEILSNFITKVEHIDKLVRDGKMDINNTVIVLFDDNWDMELVPRIINPIQERWKADFNCYLITIPVMKHVFDAQDIKQLNQVTSPQQSSHVIRTNQYSFFQNYFSNPNSLIAEIRQQPLEQEQEVKTIKTPNLSDITPAP